MKTKLVPAIVLLYTTSVFAGVKNDNPQEPFTSLKLDQEVYITDTVGILNPKMIINLVPSNNIKIFLGDGTVLTGIVKETTMQNGEHFKVFGEITNKENSGFGFVLTKDGIFAGAVVFRNTDENFTVKYSEGAKGYVFIKSLGKKVTPTSSKYK